MKLGSARGSLWCLLEGRRLTLYQDAFLWWLLIDEIWFPPYLYGVFRAAWISFLV